jgi:hypothetical protein
MAHHTELYGALYGTLWRTVRNFMAHHTELSLFFNRLPVFDSLLFNANNEISELLQALGMDFNRNKKPNLAVTSLGQ